MTLKTAGAVFFIRKRPECIVFSLYLWYIYNHCFRYRKGKRDT